VFERYIYILNIAWEAVFINKFRSMLTALGIIFGVAAVIAMMAIGRGAQKEILDQMKLVGVNNIVISSKTEKDKSSSNKSDNSSQSQTKDNSDSKESKKFSPGLTLQDAISIKAVIPTVDKVSPEVIYEVDVIRGGKKSTTKVTGITPDFFSVFNLDLIQGEMFNEEQLKDGKPVCIIGSTIKSHFFSGEDPIGKEIKCGPIWLTVIGILRNREVNQQALENLGISDYNNTIYTPIQTILLRYKDRSIINKNSLQNETTIFFGMGSISFSGQSDDKTSRNQVDKIVVQVKESRMVKPTTEVLKRMILRRHSGVSDVEIKVPELLLKQEERTRDIFNMVLGAIASISLLIGGIGIMNIMLASVMERIKEIGIRQAIGATKRDIILQFLTEATMISVTGGLIGIVLGIVLSKLITELTTIPTIVSPWSVVISFGVSATVGIAFGFMPARRASQQEPVASLRHE
jgi:putative ABC transport system permease protein